MKWNFKLKLNGINPEKIHRTQLYIDKEIISRSDDYVPMKTDSLKRSGITETSYRLLITNKTNPLKRLI